VGLGFVKHITVEGHFTCIDEAAVIFLIHNALWTIENKLMFQSNVSSLSSGSKNKLNKKLSASCCFLAWLILQP
jgi:hypothetical protein